MQQRVHLGPAEHGHDPQLVPAGEEHPGRGVQYRARMLAVGLFARLQAQRGHGTGTEPREHLGVLALPVVRALAGGRDYDDVRASPAGERDEAFQDRVVAFRVALGAADDEQPALRARPAPASGHRGPP
jgi:hypothetical protein